MSYREQTLSYSLDDCINFQPTMQQQLLESMLISSILSPKDPLLFQKYFSDLSEYSGGGNKERVRMREIVRGVLKECVRASAWLRVRVCECVRVRVRVCVHLMWEEVIEAPKRIICLSLMISGKQLIVGSQTDKQTQRWNLSRRNDFWPSCFSDKTNHVFVAAR